MPSLASFLTPLSSVLGVSTAALYERQRALVRIGVFPKATGRGRGSGGARANPETIAWMLLSLLATDNLSEVADETPRTANVLIGRKSQPTSPFARDSTLVAALTLAIEHLNIAERISALTVYRKANGAMFTLSKKKIEAPNFEDARLQAISFIGVSDAAPPAIFVQARLAGYDIVSIAEILAQKEWQ